MLIGFSALSLAEDVLRPRFGMNLYLRSPAPSQLSPRRRHREQAGCFWSHFLWFSRHAPGRNGGYHRPSFSVSGSPHSRVLTEHQASWPHAKLTDFKVPELDHDRS